MPSPWRCPNTMVCKGRGMGLEKGLELERRPKKLAGTNGRQERRRERETRATTRAKDAQANIYLQKYIVMCVFWT